MKLNLVFKNTSYLTISRLFNYAIFFGVIIFISRTLGVEWLGGYGLIFAFTETIFPFAHIGTQVFIRDFINKGDRGGILWGNAIIFRFIISCFLYLVLILAVWIYPTPENLLVPIYLTGLILFLKIFSNTSFVMFIASQRILAISLIDFVYDMVTALFLVFLVLKGFGFLGIVYAFIIGEFFRASLSSLVALWYFSKPRFLFDFKLCFKWIRQGFYFIFQKQFSESLLRVDILVISLFLGLYYTGLYQAPYKIALNVDIISTIFGFIFFPSYVYLNKVSFNFLKINYQKYKRYMIFSSLAGGLLLFLFSNSLIKFVYGNEFLQSVLIFKILIVAMIFFVLNQNNRVFLNSLKKEKVCFYFSLFTFLLNFVLDVIAIIFFGIIGVAVSTVVCAVVQFVISEYYIMKKLK